MLFRNEDAEELRIKYKYRRLIVQGSISLPYRDALRLVGPDSAYHLYGSKKIQGAKTEEVSHKKRKVNNSAGLTYSL